jgi:hypothetical protein
VSPVNGLRLLDIERNSTWPSALLHLFIAGLAFLTVPRSAEEHYGRRQLN